MATLTRGERFKDARKEFNQHGNQTMSSVEKATGVSASLIADLENDDKDRRVNYIDIATLAKHYGVTTDWLCGISDDHHISPCASSELGLSEKSLYFLKSLNGVNTYFEEMISCFRRKDGNGQNIAAKKWRDSVNEITCFKNIPDDGPYSALLALHCLELIDILISTVADNYEVMADFYELRELDPRKWAAEERISHYDFVRFKASQIAEAINRRLVEECRNHDEHIVYVGPSTEPHPGQLSFEDDYLDD